MKHSSAQVFHCLLLDKLIKYKSLSRGGGALGVDPSRNLNEFWRLGGKNKIRQSESFSENYELW